MKSKIYLFVLFLSFGSLFAEEDERYYFDYGLDVTLNILPSKVTIDNSSTQQVADDDVATFGLYGHRNFIINESFKFDVGLTFEWGGKTVDPNNYPSGYTVTYPKDNILRYGGQLRFFFFGCNPYVETFNTICSNTFLDNLSFFANIQGNHYYNNEVSENTSVSDGTIIYLDVTAKGWLFEYGWGFTYKLGNRWKLILNVGDSSGSVDIITNSAYTSTGVYTIIPTLKGSVDGRFAKLGAIYSF